MRRLIKFLSRNKVLLFILLMGLTPLIWFRDGLLITGGDFTIPLDPVGTLKSYLYAWYPYVFCGEPNAQQSLIVPWFGFWALFKSIGFSLLSVNKLWFIFVFMLAGLSMYYLVSVVFEKEKHQVIALVAPIFYMFNVYVMLVTPLMNTPLIYGALPLILGLYIKGLRAEKSSIKYAVLIGIASLLIASAINNPPIYAICGIMIFSYLVYHLATGGKKGITRSLLFTLKTAAIYLLINLWWLYPYITNVLIQSPSIKEAMRPTPGGSPFYETVRLFGSWAFYATELRGAAYFPFAHYYKTPFFITVTSIIPILAFSALPILILRHRNRLIPYFLGMAVIGIFLAHGAHPPLGSIYNFLYSHIPGFWIFREPFAKFTAITAISFAVLMGFSTDGIYRLLISRSTRGRYNILAKSLIVCVIAVILTSSWPILTGDVIFSQRGWMKSHHVEVPDYWFEAGKWFNNQNGDFRVLVLPQNPPEFYCGLNYKWGYGAADITPYLIHQPLIEERAGVGGYRLAESYGPFPPSQKLTGLVYKDFHKDSDQTVDIKTILSLMNVKYILQRNDVDWELIPYDNRFLYSPKHIKAVLETQKDIHLERTFGELDIYKIDDKYFLPRIYAPEQISYFSGDTAEGLANIAFFSHHEQYNSAFLNAEQKRSIIDKANKIFIFPDPDFLLKNGDEENSISFVVPREGSYEVLFKQTNQAEDVRDFQSAELEIDGRLVNMVDQLLDKDDRWFFFGGVYLAQGDHELRINMPTISKQISDFETNESWTSGSADTTNFKEGDQGRRITSINGRMMVSDRIDVNYDLSEWDYIDIWVYVDNIENLDTALICFGNDPYYHDQYYRYFQDLITSNGWNHLHIPKSTVNPGSGGSSWDGIMCLRIGARSKTNSEVSLTFDDWRCRSGRNIVVLRSEDYGKSIKTPDISFTRINPARYVVNVQNATEPFFLVFSESYHPRWKAFTGGEEVGQHLVINGYANGWYVDKAGTYDIILGYQDEKVFRCIVILSLATLLLCILYLAKVNPVQWVQKKYRR